MKGPNQEKAGEKRTNQEGPSRTQANCTTEIDESSQRAQGLRLRSSPSPRAVPGTFLRPHVVECIRESVDRWLRGPRQQARPSIPARATASHVDQQERSAGQARGHQQSQSRRQKEALWVPLSQARLGRGQCARAVGVNRELAPRAHVARRAGADEAGEVRVAAAAVGAGARGTRVGALPTVAAAEAQRAGAAARAASLQASAAVGAGVAGAVFQVVLAARPREAGAAAAAEGVTQIQAESACGEGSVRVAAPPTRPRFFFSARKSPPSPLLWASSISFNSRTLGVCLESQPASFPPRVVLD